MAACFDQPQSSSCRGAENIELLETAKRHKIAALTTLMISRGVFSRDHISTLPTGCQRLGLYETRSDMQSLLQEQVGNRVNEFTWRMQFGGNGIARQIEKRLPAPSARHQGRCQARRRRGVAC